MPQQAKDVSVTIEDEEETSVAERSVGSFGKYLGRFGFEVAKRPVFVIFFMILLTCLASVGFVRIEVISDGIKLWVPQQSKAMFDRKAVTQLFDTSYKNFLTVNIVSKRHDQGVLYTEAFEDTIKLNNIISRQVMDGRSKAYEELCLKTSWLNKCFFSGSKYLELWNENFTLFHNSVDLEHKNDIFKLVLSADTDVDLHLQNMKSCGSPMQVLKSIDGKEELVTDCQVLKLGYALEDDVAETHVVEWFAAVEAALTTFNSEAKYTQAFCFHKLSLDQAVQKTVLGDLHLMVTSFILMILTAICMLTKFKVDPSKPFWSRYLIDWNRSRMLTGLMAVINVALSIAGGYGLAVGVCGVEFNTLCAILPFILLGIGVDDAFVLVSGLDNATARLAYVPAENKSHKEITCERIKETMVSVGPTVTATSLTNIIAFLLGSMTTIPALRSFCIYAGICILCDYILQVTFFLSVLTLFERQQVKRMMAERLQEGQRMMKRGKKAMKESAAGSKKKASCEKVYSAFDILSWVISKTLVPLCTKKIELRVLVILASFAYAGVSTYGVMNIQQGLPLKDLTTIGSNLYAYFELEENSFENQVGPETALYYLGEADCTKRAVEIDIAHPKYQQKLLETHEFVMNKSKHIIFKQPTWLEQLIAFAERNSSDTIIYVDERAYVKEDHFYDVLEVFLKNPRFSPFSTDVQIALNECSGKEEVLSSRFHYSHAPTGKDYGIRKKALREIRSLETELQDTYWKNVDGANIFLYGLEYLFWEQDAVLFKECLLSLGLAVAGVFIVSLVIIGFHMGPIFVIVNSIILVDLYLFGFLYLLGLRFNAVTVVNLVMAVGLSIDYSLHMAHCCLERVKANSSPVENALLKIGPAVLGGGISTFMGVIPLAGSTTFIFKMFFKLMGGTVLFGQFVSLVLLPTLLSFSNCKKCK